MKNEPKKFKLLKPLPFAEAGVECEMKEHYTDGKKYIVIPVKNGNEAEEYWVDNIKDFDSWFQPIEEQRWKPCEGQTYYSVHLPYRKPYISDYMWNNDKLDNLIYKQGNCYPTREMAEKAAERVREALKGVWEGEDEIQN